MVAGQGALRSGRVRHWGPIEIVWTMVVVAGLGLGSAIAVLTGVGVAESRGQWVPKDEIGQADSWRAVEVGGLRTELPGNPQAPEAYRLEQALLPVDARMIQGDEGIAVVARVDARPPATGATAMQYAESVARLYEPGRKATRWRFTGSPAPDAVQTPTGRFYEGFLVDPADQISLPQIFRVIVAGDRTYVIVAKVEGAVAKWYPRIVDRVEVDA